MDRAAAVIRLDVVVRAPCGGELESGEKIVIAAVDIVSVKVLHPTVGPFMATRVAIPASAWVVTRHVATPGIMS